jgi:hypothetical protein
MLFNLAITLENQDEREFFLTQINFFKNYQISEILYYLGDKFVPNDNEQGIIVNKLLANPDIDVIVRANKSIKFNEKWQLELSPYLVMSKLII